MAPIPAPTGGELFLVKKQRAWRRKKASPSPQPAAPPATENDVVSDEERQRTQRLIRATIDNRLLDTLLQPIMDLQRGKAVGAEALSRFAQRPIRPPDVWFAQARTVGLGVELEMVAVRRALEQLGRLPPPLYLSINASAETIMSPEFEAAMAGVPAERIVLELTEHTTVSDYRRFGETLVGLRSRGVRLAVDDAGAGYASFRHVLDLHPDVIKLDVALTRGIDKDPARRALSSALLNFGLNAFNATMVAEGIETEGEYETLRVLGCPFGQGFYLGRPGRLTVPAAAPKSEVVAPGSSSGVYRGDYADFLALATELKALQSDPDGEPRLADQALASLRSG